MELTRGSVTDRPWGQTLGALARRGFTGQLTLFASDGKQLALAFDHGMVIGATSPVPNDVIVRIALTNHFIAASQVPVLARKLAAQPDRDEIDLIVEQCRLTPEQEIALREKAIVQRGARTFTIDHGTFVVSDDITIQTSPVVVDPFAIIYLGVRMNLSEQRLLDDLRWMGTYFQVAANALDELMRYGFGAEEQPILEAVRGGTSIPALEVEHRELDPRTMQAVLFTLAACGTAVGSSPSHLDSPRRSIPKLAAASSPNVQRIQSSEPLVIKVAADDPRTRRQSDPAVSRSQEEWQSMGTPGPSARTPMPVPAPRTISPRSSAPGLRPITPAVGTPIATRLASESSVVTTRPSMPRAPTPITPSRTATPISQTITARTATPTAQPRTATPVASRTSSKNLLKSTRPRLPSQPPLDLELDDPLEDAPTTFVDPKQEAASSFRRGEAAIGSGDLETALSELSRATTIEPENPDYVCMHVWAKFCAAKDRNTVAETTRKTIQQFVNKLEKPILPELLLGKVERLLGRDREALAHFQRVLDMKPRHAEAAAEIRVIELRQAAASKSGGGLFGRKH